MRVALVIAPPHAPENPEPPAPVARLRERLVLAGFNVVNLATTPQLLPQVASAATLIGEEDSALLVLACATRLGDDGALRIAASADGNELGGEECARATCTGAEETIPVASLGDILRAQRPRESFFIVDARHDGMGDDVMRAAEHIDALVSALAVKESGDGLLAGAHAGPSEGEDWPLTRAYLDLLDAPGARDDKGDLLASRACDRLRDGDALRARVPSFALLKGTSDFVLDPAPIPAPTPSRRPPASLSSMRPPPSEPHRSMRPIALPELDPILFAAAEARETQQWERALDEYKRALMVVSPSDRAAKASIYAYIGEVKRAQGKLREAELNFEKALGESPGHRRSLDALVALATEAKEWRRAVEFRRALAATADDGRRRVAELLKIAGLCEKELGDAAGAARALEEARELTPQDAGILHKLRALYEGSGAWSKVADVLGALSDMDGTPLPARADLRFAQADVVLARLRDDARGCALLEKALKDDPAHDKALAALIAVRTRCEQHRELEGVLVDVADRMAARGELERAAEACKRLAVLRRDRLRDRAGAVEAYAAALRCKPGDADARALLAELHVAAGELEVAARELETASQFVPTRAATYKRLFELHTRAGRTDRAWLAATALHELGAAEMDHELALEQFKTVTGSVRPAAALDEQAWRRLAAPGVSEEVGAILRALLPAAVPMKLAELGAKKKLVELDPRRKQAATSTASVVRSFVWASQVLGVDVPDLYVLDDVPGGVAAVQSATPSTALGPSVLSGLGVPALAFVSARHLTYYRPENYLLVFYPSVGELSMLVLSGLKLVVPKMPASKPIAEGALRLERELARIEGARAKLDEAARALEASGGRMDLHAHVRGVELTAHRAGLLAAADFPAVFALIKGEERPIAELSYEDKRGDLLACCASNAFSELRGRLGIAARGA